MYSTALMLTTDREGLVREIADVIVDAVNLRHKNKDDMRSDTPLMALTPEEGGLGLDSLDMLEVVVAIEQRYGVKIQDPDEGKRVFRTLGSIADFLHAKNA